MSVIIKAAQLAEEWHRGQVRKYNGRPYIEHPIRVAGRLATMPNVTENQVAAAFLHDVCEDCSVSWHEIEDKFNTEVAVIVCKLTNPSKGSNLPRSERKLMDREHLRNAPNIVKIIKMIDRIDNLNEMSGADIGFKRKYCQESKLLAEAIGDADNNLYHELCSIIENMVH